MYYKYELQNFHDPFLEEKVLRSEKECIDYLKLHLGMRKVPDVPNGWKLGFDCDKVYIIDIVETQLVFC